MSAARRRTARGRRCTMAAAARSPPRPHAIGGPRTSAGSASMTTGRPDLVGIGLYTWPEAARLVSVRPLELRRWLKGYSFRTKSASSGQMSRLWEPDLIAAGVDGLSFEDLLEVRVVQALRRRGLSLQYIRDAHREASVLFGTRHPFSTQRILSDGIRVFAKT